MAAPVPAYPDGLIGAGLALLRLSLAAMPLIPGRGASLTGPWQWVEAALCVCLAFGVWTRWSAGLGALGLVALVLARREPEMLLISTSLLVLVLTGPGAYAIDARIWGRVQIRL